MTLTRDQYLASIEMLIEEGRETWWEANRHQHATNDACEAAWLAHVQKTREFFASLSEPYFLVS